MFLVKNTDDAEIARFLLANIPDPVGKRSCLRASINGMRAESMRILVKLCFLNQVTGPQAPFLHRCYELGKVTTADQTRAQWDQVISRQKESVQKLQKQFFTQQLQNLVKQQQKQQQEMATVWRDLMKIENETLIRKINDPNPLVSLFAIQVAGKKRLPVEKESINLLSNGNPSIRQAARQTLIRLGRGVDFGPDASASQQQVAASVRGWSSWLALQGDADDEEDDVPHSR